MLRHYEKRHEATKQKKPSVRYPVIGNYVMLDEIGRGAFGEVRMALSLDTLQPVAIKIISKERAREYSSSKAVRKEIKIMQELQHPNIVNLIDVLSTQSRVLVVMDLIDGGGLFTELNLFGRLSEPYARFFFQQLVQGLDYCHSNGVCHRDLKLDNLLLDKNKTLKISDFGMSTYKTRIQEMLHTPVGTPMFVAPELIGVSPEGYSGAKSDVWSCGIILFMLCSGNVPFVSDNLYFLFHLIKQCYVEYPAYFSDELKDLLSNILQPNTNNRISLRKVINHPWMKGPITTSEVGDERRNVPTTLQQMSPKILEVIHDYASYKQEAELLKGVARSLVPVTVNPSPPATNGPQAGPSRSRHRKPPGFDSLAIGWVKDTDFVLSGLPLPTPGSSNMRFPLVSNGTRNSNAIAQPPSPQSESSESDTQIDSEVSSVTDSEDETDITDTLDSNEDEHTDDFTATEDQWGRLNSHPNLSDRILGSDSDFNSDFRSFSSKYTNPRCARSMSDFGIRRAGAYSSDERSQVVDDQDEDDIGKVELLRNNLWKSFVVSWKTKQNAVSGDESSYTFDCNQSHFPNQHRARYKSLKRERFSTRQKNRLHTKPPHSDTETSKTSSPSSKFKSKKGERNSRRVRFPSLSSHNFENTDFTFESDDYSSESDVEWWDTGENHKQVSDIQDFGMVPDELDNLWATRLGEEDCCRPSWNKRKRAASISWKFRDQADSQPNSSMVQNEIYKQATVPISNEVSVVQSLPAIKLEKAEETIVILGDVLTMNAVGEEHIKRFVEKTGFDKGKGASIEMAKRSTRKNPTCRAVEYFNYVVSIAKGETHDSLAKMKEKNQIAESERKNAAQNNTDAPDDASIAVATTEGAALESILTHVGESVGGLNTRVAREDERLGIGLRRVAIGPLDAGYEGGSGDDCTTEDSEKRGHSDVTRNIFSISVSGPDPRDAITRPTTLPFEEILGKPFQYVRHFIRVAKEKFLNRNFSRTFTTVYEMEYAVEIMRDMLEHEGAQLDETEVSETQTKFEFNHVVDGCDICILTTVSSNSYSICDDSTITLSRVSGPKNKYLQFIDILTPKLQTHSRYNYEARK